MKKIIYAFLLIFCSITVAEASGDPIKKFYREYKKKDQVFMFTKDEDVKAGLKLAKKMKNVRVLVDNGQQVPLAAGKNLIKDLRLQGNLETLIAMRKNGSHTVIMGQLKGDKIKKIVVITFAEDEFTMIAAKSRLKIKDVNHLIYVLENKN